MHRTQIMLEQEQHKALTEMAHSQNRSLSDLIREMLSDQLELDRQRQLADAAQALLADYETDPDLTAFTALDGDSFHAEG
jgi:predicted DNA-binding ribbon-helix-helix protein